MIRRVFLDEAQAGFNIVPRLDPLETKVATTATDLPLAGQPQKDTQLTCWLFPTR